MFCNYKYALSGVQFVLLSCHNIHNDNKPKSLAYVVAVLCVRQCLIKNNIVFKIQMMYGVRIFFFFYNGKSLYCLPGTLRKYERNC